MSHVLEGVAHASPFPRCAFFHGEIDKPAQGFLHRGGRKPVTVAISLEGVHVIDSREKVPPPASKGWDLRCPSWGKREWGPEGSVSGLSGNALPSSDVLGPVRRTWGLPSVCSGSAFLCCWARCDRGREGWEAAPGSRGNQAASGCYIDGFPERPHSWEPSWAVHLVDEPPDAHPCLTSICWDRLQYQ